MVFIRAVIPAVRVDEVVDADGFLIDAIDEL